MRVIMSVMLMSAVCLSGCGGKPSSAVVAEPKGVLVWRHAKLMTPVDLAGNFTGDRSHFAGSVENVYNGTYLGKLTWEFFPRTQRFGDVILVRIALPERRPFDTVLTSGTYAVIYQDDENRIEYVEKGARSQDGAAR